MYNKMTFAQYLVPVPKADRHGDHAAQLQAGYDPAPLPDPRQNALQGRQNDLRSQEQEKDLTLRWTNLQYPFARIGGRWLCGIIADMHNRAAIGGGDGGGLCDNGSGNLADKLPWCRRRCLALRYFEWWRLHRQCIRWRFRRRRLG